ncbi:MAG TPA: CRTAC1 family protein [Verrucomicrobiae bacterium]
MKTKSHNPRPNNTKLCTVLVGMLLAAAGTGFGQDSTFTRITTGQVVTDVEISGSGCWWDYDNDNFPDLFVARMDRSSPVPNTLYHNNGDGTFSRVTTNAITTTTGAYSVGSVGDLDNDGFLDLVVADWNDTEDLFHNDGSGRFTRLSSAQSGLSDSDGSDGAAWVDYDTDGFLDLFTPNFGGAHCLYRNRGDGMLIKMTSGQVGSIVADVVPGWKCSWADCDNDGYPDVWLDNGEGPNCLHHNNGDGTFSRITAGSVTSEGSANVSGIWGDYDNDGLLDLFTTGEYVRVNSLHRNLGNNLFTNVAISAGVAWQCDAFYAAWGDYDNDGYLDIFVSRYSGTPNVLFRNNGDGTFSSVEVGSPLTDGDQRLGTVWEDYNNDGFLDLFIACGWEGPLPNLLYLNNGNGNSWLRVKLVGIASNRSATGAKVRVRATIGGRTFWQMREVSGNNCVMGGQGLIPHFGLGDATTVDLVRVQWPSGIVQTLTNVAAKQMLTVSEHQEYGGAVPTLSAPTVLTNGVQLAITEPDALAVYALEASTNLVTWTKLMARKSGGGTFAYTDTRSADYPRRFYRVVVP